MNITGVTFAFGTDTNSVMTITADKAPIFADILLVAGGGGGGGGDGSGPWIYIAQLMQ